MEVLRVAVHVCERILVVSIVDPNKGALAPGRAVAVRGTVPPPRQLPPKTGYKKSPTTRVWIFGVVFGNFGAPFGRIFARPRAAGPHNLVPDGLTALAGSHEISGAHLGP